MIESDDLDIWLVRGYFRQMSEYPVTGLERRQRFRLREYETKDILDTSWGFPEI